MALLLAAASAGAGGVVVVENQQDLQKALLGGETEVMVTGDLLLVGLVYAPVSTSLSLLGACGDGPCRMQCREGQRHRGVLVEGAGAFTMQNFRVEGCRTPAGEFENGGGLLAQGLSALTLRNVTFARNEASAGGGGLRAEGVTRVEVEDCSFFDNTADGYTSRGLGGALSVEEGEALVVRGGLFHNNSAASGGGAVAWVGSGTVELLGGRFEENGALGAGGGGGALSIASADSVRVEGCTLKDNLATMEGGAVRLRPPEIRSLSVVSAGEARSATPPSGI